MNFFVCIKEHISYNSVYLILAFVKNFLRSNEIETVNTSRKHQFHYLTFNVSVAAKFLTRAEIKYTEL